MKMIGIKQAVLATMLFAAFFSFAGNLTGKSNSIFQHQKNVKVSYEDIVRVDEWATYKKFGGIEIEYKFQDCHSTDERMFNNLTMVFFRFTNTTNQKLELFWATELYFDGTCENCEKLENVEHEYSLKLDAHQVIAGDCSTMGNKTLYIAANFIKLSPGMTGTRLTNFNFINLRTSVWK